MRFGRLEIIKLAAEPLPGERWSRRLMWHKTSTEVHCLDLTWGPTAHPSEAVAWLLRGEGLGRIGWLSWESVVIVTMTYADIIVAGAIDTLNDQCPCLSCGFMDVDDDLLGPA